MRRWRHFLPLVLFVLVGGFLLVGLGLNPRLLPSPLVGQSVPPFDLPTLEDPDIRVGDRDLAQGVHLVNVWASWCVSCRHEHPLLVRLVEEHGVSLVGIHYKDDRSAGLRYLESGGNPYRWNAHDREGLVGIDWGVYGTPETFVVDYEGTIRFKHVGPLTPDLIDNTLLPLLARLEQEALP